jgi:hypothetical protein
MQDKYDNRHLIEWDRFPIIGKRDRFTILRVWRHDSQINPAIVCIAVVVGITDRERERERERQVDRRKNTGCRQTAENTGRVVCNRSKWPFVGLYFYRIQK